MVIHIGWLTDKSQASVDIGNKILEVENVMGALMAMAATENKEAQVGYHAVTRFINL